MADSRRRRKSPDPAAVAALSGAEDPPGVVVPDAGPDGGERLTEPEDDRDPVEREAGRRHWDPKLWFAR